MTSIYSGEVLEFISSDDTSLQIIFKPCNEQLNYIRSSDFHNWRCTIYNDICRVFEQNSKQKTQYEMINRLNSIDIAKRQSIVQSNVIPDISVCDNCKNVYDNTKKSPECQQDKSHSECLRNTCSECILSSQKSGKCCVCEKRFAIECPICFEEVSFEHVTVSRVCDHIVCNKCYIASMRSSNPIEKCPCCRSVGF